MSVDGIPVIDTFMKKTKKKQIIDKNGHLRNTSLYDIEIDVCNEDELVNIGRIKLF